MPHISEPLLQAYIDDSCADARVGEIESHLEACAECRARLAAARAAAQQASRLLSTLDPGPMHAPSFEELQARAAQRQTAAVGDGDATPDADGASEVDAAPDVDDALDAGGARVPDFTARAPEAVVPFWRRPAMAWAATVVIAFGLGWISRAVPRAPASSTLGERGAEAASPDQEPADDAGARRDLDAVDGPARAAVPEAAAKAEPQAAPPAQPSTPSVAVNDEEVVPRQQVAEGQAPAGRAGELSSTFQEKFAAAPPAEQIGGQAGAATETDVGITNELEAADANYFADAVPPGFVAVALEDAEPWLGVAPRQIPDLTLLRAEVGPGTLAGVGIPGRAVVRLVYRAPSGQQIVLLQQYTGPLEGRDLAQVGDSSAEPGAAVVDALAPTERPRAEEEARLRALRTQSADERFRAAPGVGAERDAPAGIDAKLPATFREPDGRVTYRWLDAGGYLLSISGDIDPDLLRGLADLVR